MGRKKGSSLAQPIRLNEEQQKLAAGCLPLAVRLGGWFARLHELDYEDCVSAASLRLVYAAARFDPTLGPPFSSYAFKAICRAVGFLVQEREVKRRVRGVAFSQMPDARKGGAFDPVCYRASELAPLEVREQVERLARILPQRSFRILWEYYGMNRTRDEVAEDIGLSKQRVDELILQAWRSALRRMPKRSSTLRETAAKKERPATPTKLTRTQDKILAVLRMTDMPIPITVIAVRAGLPFKSYLREMVYYLLQRGLIEKVGGCTYQLASINAEKDDGGVGGPATI